MYFIDYIKGKTSNNTYSINFEADTCSYKKYENDEWTKIGDFVMSKDGTATVDNITVKYKITTGDIDCSNVGVFNNIITMETNNGLQIAISIYTERKISNLTLDEIVKYIGNFLTSGQLSDFPIPVVVKRTTNTPSIAPLGLALETGTLVLNYIQYSSTDNKLEVGKTSITRIVSCISKKSILPL